MKATPHIFDTARRNFNRSLFSGFLASTCPSLSFGYQPQDIQVAAIQMQATLANVSANLEQAEKLITQAQKKGANWIILPEFFSSAMAFHPDMLSAIQGIDGAPAQMLKRLAMQGDTHIGGSFLAERDGHVYNSFLLLSPEGDTQQHDKDQPSYWENCFYQGGSDTGILETELGKVGAALCWELIRTQTMRRLKNNVRLVLSGSCWWTLSDDIDKAHPLHQTNIKLLQQAPVNCARTLGVPVIHASHTGKFNGLFSPELPDIPYNSHYLGETMIVDSTGVILAKRSAQQGPGIVISKLKLPSHASPSTKIPERFWMPNNMPDAWKASWERWLESGPHYYENVTKPYLQTGKLNEYIPKYME